MWKKKNISKENQRIGTYIDIKECWGRLADGYKTGAFNKLEINFISITQNLFAFLWTGNTCITIISLQIISRVLQNSQRKWKAHILRESDNPVRVP